jgi:hypothetical protein
MDIDIKKLENLLSEGRHEEAGSLIKEAFSKDLDGKEKGQLLFSAARAHMKLVNSINDKYISVLKDAIKAAEDLDKFESKVSDQISLDQLHKTLNS